MKTAKILIPNDIGYKLSAVVVDPERESRGLAIVCPGFLDTKDHAHLVALADTLAENGYTAIRFDPMGTWESEGAIEDYTISQHLKDLRSIINFAFEQGSYPDVFVMGHSIGGMLAILYAARDPRVTKVVSIMSPFTYVRPNREDERGEQSAWAKTGFHSSRRDIPDSREVKEFKVPYSFVVDSRNYNILNDIPKIHVPVLLIAGENDDDVPPEYMRMIYDRASEPKHLVVMEGMDHDYRHHPEQIRLVNEEILKFIRQRVDSDAWGDSGE